jgi:hypothetical protein
MNEYESACDFILIILEEAMIRHVVKATILLVIFSLVGVHSTRVANPSGGLVILEVGLQRMFFEEKF